MLLTTRNVRLDSGHYATKYYCHFALDFCQINAIYRNKNSKLLTSIFSDFRKRKIAHFSCFIFQNSGHIAQRARPSHLFLKKLPKLHFKPPHEILNIFGPSAFIWSAKRQYSFGNFVYKVSQSRSKCSWTYLFKCIII